MTLQPPPRFQVPLEVPTIPALTTFIGAGGLSSALVTGYIPSTSPIVWPLVALVAISAAYDLGRRTLALRSVS